MANQVFANGMEIACKSGAGKVIAAFPDVCMTPPENPATPPGVPVPYPNTAMASDTTDGSKSVKISDKEVMLKNKSCFKTSTGDEAGCAAKKGLISSKNKGKVYFIKWSMDVKIEGENVDRHFDMTTNNHGSPTANEALPWMFLDSQALSDVTHPCNKSGDADLVTDNCASPPEDDTTVDCCNARKCMLVPYSPNKCCDGENGKQKTPHHVVPKSQFYKSGFAGKSTIAMQDEGALLLDKDGDNKYLPNKAPCVCEEGESHSTGKHGDIHTETNIATLAHSSVTVSESGKSVNKNAEWNVSDSESIGSKAVEDVTKCDKDCIEAQVRKVHESMGIKPDDKIRPTTAGRSTRKPEVTSGGL